jgi:UDPglucose 6-dehydrogenase
MRPDRIVIGCDDTPEGERARALMRKLYAPFNRNHERTFWMDVRSAEFTKYAANAMLATRISFMNELANLADKVGADIEAVRHGIGSDPRIGHSFLYAGAGYGGSCFPKDVKALVATGREVGVDLEILKWVEATNQRQKLLLVQKALRHFGGSLSGRFFAVWGLSFKPRTDDVRESPAIDLIEGLLGKGARVRAHDPVAEPIAERHFGDRILYAPTQYDCVEGTDGLFVVTEWSQFRKPDLARIRHAMRTPVVFDGRNVFDPDAIRELGFAYYGVGRT